MQMGLFVFVFFTLLVLLLSAFLGLPVKWKYLFPAPQSGFEKKGEVKIELIGRGS